MQEIGELMMITNLYISHVLQYKSATHYNIHATHFPFDKSIASQDSAITEGGPQQQ